MALIDTHAHLTYPELSGQIEAVLERAAAAGVVRIISIGTDVTETRNALALASQFPDVVSVAAGFHPHEAERVGTDDAAAMAELWLDPHVVALGEMGLDYHYDFADRAAQQAVFESQLSRAAEHDKPLVIHSREALADTIMMLRRHGFENRRVVFHCFTGTTVEAAQIGDMGWRISFTGVVTFKKSRELQEIARAYPANQIMVETDSPYLSPEPVRGTRPCEPALVAHTAKFLARLRDVSYEEFAGQATANARAFFGLPN